MTMLSHEELVRLHAVVIEAGLERSRDALLAAVPTDVVATIPHATAPATQLLADLVSLNRAHILQDGTIPLKTWLLSARALASQRSQRDTFDYLLSKVSSETPMLEPARGTEAVSSTTLPISPTPSSLNRWSYIVTGATLLLAVIASNSLRSGFESDVALAAEQIAAVEDANSTGSGIMRNYQDTLEAAARLVLRADALSVDPQSPQDPRDNATKRQQQLVRRANELLMQLGSPNSPQVGYPSPLSDTIRIASDRNLSLNDRRTQLSEHRVRVYAARAAIRAKLEALDKQRQRLASNLDELLNAPAPDSAVLWREARGMAHEILEHQERTTRDNRSGRASDIDFDQSPLPTTTATAASTRGAR